MLMADLQALVIIQDVLIFLLDTYLIGRTRAVNLQHCRCVCG